ncbi:unnamed protein product, partial [Musa textilis]
AIHAQASRLRRDALGRSTIAVHSQAGEPRKDVLGWSTVAIHAQAGRLRRDALGRSTTAVPLVQGYTSSLSLFFLGAQATNGSLARAPPRELVARVKH